MTQILKPSSLALLLAALPLAAQAPPPAKTVDLSPARWTADDLAAARAIDYASGGPPQLAESRRAMVATTSFGGTAARAGLEAMRQGGSAVDAALTTALTQTVLNLGSWTSFAGILSMVVYDAESGQVFTLEGGWNTVKAETDPASIPDPASPEAPGRSVLVPGFMAAVQAAHDRFGRLPFAELFAPAIYFAEEGFELHRYHGFMIDGRKDALRRHPAGRALFTRTDGELYGAGDRFRQPRLAATLRAVARDGAAVMYRGAWARALVDAVRDAGGRMTLSDLKAYRPAWLEPARGTFDGYEIAGLGLPSRGGVEAVEAFQLLDAAGLDPARHYSRDAAELYKIIQIQRVARLFLIGAADEALWTRLFGDLDFSPYGRTQPATSRAIWQRLAAPEWPAKLRAALDALPPVPPPEGHSDAVVAIDEQGNTVALLHTINTVLWGDTGLFVGGVSISDAGGRQAARLAATGAGFRVYDGGHPYLVLQGGKPVVASASIGRGLHSKAFQNVVNLLVYDMDPAASLAAPQTLGGEFRIGDDGRRPYDQERVYAGAFAPEVLAALAARGQEVVLVDRGDRRGIGYWVGLKVDPESGLVQASAPPEGGHAVGY